jgi:hypothetical protein
MIIGVGVIVGGGTGVSVTGTTDAVIVCVAVTGAGVAVAGGSTGSVAPLQAVNAARNRAASRGIGYFALVGFIRSSFG